MEQKEVEVLSNIRRGGAGNIIIICTKTQIISISTKQKRIMVYYKKFIANETRCFFGQS